MNRWVSLFLKRGARSMRYVAGCILLTASALAVVSFAEQDSVQASSNEKLPSAPVPELAFEVELLTPAETQAWWPIGLDTHIRNFSSSRSWPYVAWGDGSSMGFRDPKVTTLIEIKRDNGLWVMQEPLGVGGCGNYDHDWRDEVRFLAPGERRHFQARFLGVGAALAPQTRFSLTYHYTARPSSGAPFTDKILPPEEAFGEMRGIPPFSLKSNVIQLAGLIPEVTREAMLRDLKLELLSDSGRVVSAHSTL